MKNRWLPVLWVCFALPNISNAQDACVKARRVIDQINKIHVQPRAVNDSLSADIFSEFFKTLDPYGEILISADTGKLVRYRNELDNGNEAVCLFLREATTLYRKKLQWYQRFADSLMSNPLNFSKKETGPAAIHEAMDLCKTNAELKTRITQDIKLSVLLSIYRGASADSTLLINAVGLSKGEPAARQRVRKNKLVEIDRLLKDPKLLTGKVEDSYLKSIPAVYDPHSTYFGEAEMKKFSEALNPNELSFGIKVDEDLTGQVKVSKVVPGSPAWNSNQINKDDVLISIRWRPSGEYTDLIDLDADIVEEALAGKENSAEITVQKPTGEHRTVKLIKAKLENEENIVSGFVLTGKDSKRKVGYINLPGFFTDVDPSGGGCAVAVTKEIIKLKGESIEGLILDLRFNGGGSLYEAIGLAGLFIDVGPLSVIEKNSEPPVVLKDINRGLVYDGPLVIMVNGASASASEIVAAALQDYHRAVLAGSPTYGKATGQTVVPIDEKHPEQGFLKITELRVYRINGQTHQGKGVIPDFPLNDFSSMFYPREEQSPYALKPRTVNKKTFYSPWTDYFSKSLGAPVENHSKPVNSRELTDLQKIYTSPIPLEQQAFVSFMKNMESILGKITAGQEEGTYSVSNSQYDKDTFSLDGYHKEMNNEILEQVSSSAYIQDVFRLLENIIAAKK